jgi:hypothetical protein
MPVTAFLSVIGDLQPDIVGIGEEGGGVVRGIFRIEPGIGCRDAGGLQLAGRLLDIGGAFHTQIQVM